MCNIHYAFLFYEKKSGGNHARKYILKMYTIPYIYQHSTFPEYNRTSCHTQTQTECIKTSIRVIEVLLTFVLTLQVCLTLEKVYHA